MELNDKVQKVVHAGIGLALVAKERAEQVFDELAEKGKLYKEQFDAEEEETEEDDEDFSNTTEESASEEGKKTFINFEELGNKAKQTIARLQLAKSEVEESMETRIENLEGKLNALVDAALETMDLERKSSKKEATTETEEFVSTEPEVVAEEETTEEVVAEVVEDNTTEA